MWIGDLTLRLRNWIAEVAQDGPFGNHATLTDGLVSYWALDELSGTRYDSVTATGNDLTDNNTVTYAVEGPRGTVADFVAANSEYLSQATALIPRDGSSFSVSIWAYLATPGDATKNWLVTQGNQTIWIAKYDSDLAIDFVGGGEAYATKSVAGQPAGWFHIVAWYDSADDKTRILFNNGTAGVSSGTASGGATNAAFAVGRVAGGGAGTVYNDGEVAQVGVWSKVLSAAEITSLFNSGRGKSYSELTDDEKVSLVSYWNLDEVSGARYDSHGANDLTDNNTVGSVNSGPEGVVAVFVNANNEVLTNATNVMSADSNFTAVAWTRLRSAATGHANELFSTTDGDFILRCNGEYPQIVGRGFADSTYWNGGTAIPIEQWKMLTGWHDADNNQFGISVDNGVRTTVATGGANGAGTAIAIGARDSTPTDTTETDGDISRVGCWTRVLTADEQNTLFNEGVGLRYDELPAGLLVGLVSYWDLTETSGTRSDSHGTNHLTDNNTVTYTINKGGASEGVGASFTLDNVEYLSNTGLLTTLAPTDSVTLSFWIRPTLPGTSSWLIQKDDTNTKRCLTLALNNVGTLTLYVFDDDWPTTPTYEQVFNHGTVPLVDSVWHHVLIEMDGSTKRARVAVNNLFGNYTAALPNGFNYDTDAPFILNSSNYPTTAIYDEMGLWNRVLTAQERTDLFNAGRGLFYND